MKAINELSQELTIYLITSHLSTVQWVDRIFLLEKGRLIARVLIRRCLSRQRRLIPLFMESCEA